ncbi:MAG: GTP-binding protein [Promethearchaeota archaeon]
MSEEYLDDLFKIIVLGASGVGKTTIMELYAEKVFEEQRTQKMGVNFFTKQLKINEDNYKLQFWDFISNKQFEKFHQLYASGASAVLFVFDLSRPETFDYHKVCLKNIWWQINLNRAPLLLIGNKIDTVGSQGKIERKKYREFVIKEGIYGYIETSTNDISQLEEKIPSLVKQIVYLKSFYGKQRPRNTRAKVIKEIKEQAIPSHIEGKFLKEIDIAVLEEREREKIHRMEELEKVEEALKKTQQVKFLVDEKELDFIKKYAQLSHQTQSEFIRTAIWEKVKLIDHSFEIDNLNERTEDSLRLDELIRIRELLGKLKK